MSKNFTLGKDIHFEYARPQCAKRDSSRISHGDLSFEVEIDDFQGDYPLSRVIKQDQDGNVIVQEVQDESEFRVIFDSDGNKRIIHPQYPPCSPNLHEQILEHQLGEEELNSHAFDRDTEQVHLPCSDCENEYCTHTGLETNHQIKELCQRKRKTEYHDGNPCRSECWDHSSKELEGGNADLRYDNLIKQGEEPEEEHAVEEDEEV